MTAPLQDWQLLVHSPLAHWAQTRPNAIALDDGIQRISFAELHATVQRHTQALNDSAAPSICLLDATLAPAALITEFLAVNASGRCAALGDAEWPDMQRLIVEHWIADLATTTARCTDPKVAGDSPFYIGFTSGSTGRPKGFRRHHRSWSESFRICSESFGGAAQGCVMAPGNLSHSLFLFGALMGIWTGGGAQLQVRFSAAQCLVGLRANASTCLVAVPSQLLLMLQLAERRKFAPIDSVRLVLISGARWMRQHTPALQALFPQARVVEFYGASEASFIAWMDADPNMPAQVVGRAFDNVQLQIRSDAGHPLPAGQIGQIWIRSPMLFMDYVGGSADGTAALRAGEHDEWLSVRDLGHLDDSGLLTLVGREKRMLVTQGKNLFPEEVEALLCEHPRVAAASVHGVDDPLRGKQVWAAVQLRDPPPTADNPAPAPTPLADTALAFELSAWCRGQLQAYKCPRRWFSCAPWPQTQSGKTDHAQLAAGLQAWQDTHQPAHDQAEPQLLAKELGTDQI